jgi:type IV pilus assembly protein PilB
VYCSLHQSHSEEELMAARWPERELGVPLSLWKPVGCRTCSNTGYRGRLALHEVMPVSEEIERLAVRRASANEIHRVAIDEGMQDLRIDGLFKAREGQTSIREVLRVAI